MIGSYNARGFKQNQRVICLEERYQARDYPEGDKLKEKKKNDSRINIPRNKKIVTDTTLLLTRLLISRLHPVIGSQILDVIITVIQQKMLLELHSIGNICGTTRE